MEPQASPSKNSTRAVPTANLELPVNDNANAPGAIRVGGSGAVGEQTGIKQAVEAKRLGDRFGLNYDLVLRNLDRLRQAAALEDVTFGEFHLPFGIGESEGAASGQAASTSRSAAGGQTADASLEPNAAGGERSDVNHGFDETGPHRNLLKEEPNATSKPLDDSDAARKQFLLRGGGGHFMVKDNPNSYGGKPPVENVEWSRVNELDTEIVSVAKEMAVDPNLLRAIMFVETTHGYYDYLFAVADANKSILPMNVNVDYWGDHFGTREQLKNPRLNIIAGAKMLKAIEGNLPPNTSIEKIATLYNNHLARKVSNYGARVAEIYKTRPWEWGQPYQFRRGPLPERRR